MDDPNILSVVPPTMEEVNSTVEVDVRSVANSGYECDSEYDSNSDTDDDDESFTADRCSDINDATRVNENIEAAEVVVARVIAEVNVAIVGENQDSDDEELRQSVPAFQRRIPTRFFSDQMVCLQYRHTIASNSQSGYARNRAWAQKMKEKYNLTGQDNLVKSKYKHSRSQRVLKYHLWFSEALLEQG